MLVWATKDGRVQRIHHQPHLLEPAKQAGAVNIDEGPPEPPQVGRGEQSVLYLRDGALVYDVEPRELTEEERTAEALDRLDALIGVAEAKSLLTRDEVDAEVERRRTDGRDG